MMFSKSADNAFRSSLSRNRAYAQSSREQGCDKLSILLNGITTSVSPMVLSQHPMHHAQKRASGTNAKFGLGPRVRSVYQVAPVSSMVCRGSARIMCSEADVAGGTIMDARSRQWISPNDPPISRSTYGRLPGRGADMEVSKNVAEQGRG